MNTAIFGGTGFIGSYIVQELVARQIQTRVFVRQREERKMISKSLYSTLVYGDINENADIDKVIDGCEAVIYSIGIIREYEAKGITFAHTHFQLAKQCIDRAVQANIKRFVLISANGASIDGTAYQSSKYMAEEYLKNSGLEYTIFRPSVVFGESSSTLGQEFCSQLAKDIVNKPFFAPSFFEGFKISQAGEQKLAPIFVEDVAKVITLCLDQPKCANQIYSLCGEAFTWKQIISLIAKVQNKSKSFFPVPAKLVFVCCVLLDKFDFFPITREQLIMLLEGNICSDEGEDICALLGVEKTLFNEKSLRYLAGDKEGDVSIDSGLEE